MGFIVAFLLFIQSGESIYDPPTIEEKLTTFQRFEIILISVFK